MTFFGMDTAQGEEFASLMETRRGSISELVDQLESRIAAIDSYWRGSDAEDFRGQWSGVRSGSIAQALEALKARIEDLLGHAEAQEGASQADDGFDWGDVFRIGEFDLRNSLPNDWEDVLGIGVSAVLDALGGAYDGLKSHLGKLLNPKTAAVIAALYGEDMVSALKGAAKFAKTASKALGVVGAVATFGFAAWDRWEADSADPSLTTGERVARAAVDGAANAAGGALGGWGGAAAGMAIGTAICPGVGTVIGGAIGGALGGFAGTAGGNALGDWLLG